MHGVLQKACNYEAYLSVSTAGRPDEESPGVEKTQSGINLGRNQVIILLKFTTKAQAHQITGTCLPFLQGTL